jgi:hypothetical protein
MKIKPELKTIMHTIELNDDELNDVYKGLRLLIGQDTLERENRHRIDGMIKSIEKIGNKLDEIEEGLDNENN